MHMAIHESIPCGKRLKCMVANAPNEITSRFVSENYVRKKNKFGLSNDSNKVNLQCNSKWKDWVAGKDQFLFYLRVKKKFLFTKKSELTLSIFKDPQNVVP
ncbi:hypothetical protein JTE90_018559 [Oedothorax gibbosus]|uniref:Uncharacterized protein n=1 Tax=Oedothorax gibbosus TaxID=931172 RepID=A0AAV6U4B1_9ARAC|nr:hypothetical protein JTE90_018559 [Oedothorax gibbosus]